MENYNYISDVIGIDIGLSKCCVGVWRNRQVEIIPNDQGNRITPSYVAFTDTEILVGDLAKEQAIDNPKNTIFDFKQLIGKSIDDAEITKIKKSYSFEILEMESKPVYKIKTKNIVRYYTPEGITTIILVYLKNCSEKYIGTSVNKAVITVPVYFNSHQRQSIINVGKLAGFDFITILDDPVAAVIAYGFINQKVEKVILVLDCGGGTFDVSVLKIYDNEYQILGNSEYLYYSGNYFDSKLINFFIEKFKNKKDLDISNNPQCINKLKYHSKKVKRILSSNTEVFVKIKSFYNEYDFETSITQSCFNSSINLIPVSIFLRLDKFLSQEHVKKTDINDIVLVGGSSKIPKFQQSIKKEFDIKNKEALNPIEAITISAAIFAKNLKASNNKLIQNISKIESNAFTSDSESTIRGINKNIMNNIKNAVDESSENVIKTTRSFLDDKYQTLNKVTRQFKHFTVKCPYQITGLHIEIKNKHKVNNREGKEIPYYSYKINIDYENDDQEA